MLREVLTHSFVALSAIFVVVDPFAAVPFFLAMTSEQSPEERRETARRAAIGAWLILTAFGLLGALLFLTGVILVSFGLMGELLVRTWHESQGKPIYVVLERRKRR